MKYLAVIAATLLVVGLTDAANPIPSTCSKNADCPSTMLCNMTDFYNYPKVWPPCPHAGGVCACRPETPIFLSSNSSCAAMVNMTLGQSCSNAANEAYGQYMQCTGGTVQCFSSFTAQGSVCMPPTTTTQSTTTAASTTTQSTTTQSTTTPTSTTTTTPPSTTTGTFPSTPSTKPPPAIVGYLAACDSNNICDITKGLTCQQKGSNATYSECICQNTQYIFKNGSCQLRVYYDACDVVDDCNGGLIGVAASTVCQENRCVCATGYDALDNLFWNETGRSTYSRKICVISAATSYVPTGQACTVNPHLYSSTATIRVCQPRAFCHLCAAQRVGIKNFETDIKTQTTGVCRELSCSADGDCGGNGLVCSQFNSVFDPPCTNGVCNCDNSGGKYIDPFSRCSTCVNRKPGERCLPESQPSTWFINQEDYDAASLQCVPTAVPAAMGYTGYAFGEIKCNAGYIDSNQSGICNSIYGSDSSPFDIKYLGLGATCDPNDKRIGRSVCNASAGLSCQSTNGAYSCQCQTASAYSTGCGTGSGGIFWDGTTCRARIIGDQCKADSDCPPKNYGTSGSCSNGVCSCDSGFTATTIGNTAYDASMLTLTSNSSIVCMANVTQVAKGGECHLSPVAWACQVKTGSAVMYGYSATFLGPQVCSSGLYCVRCLADSAPDDETHGICRSVTAPPSTLSCSQCSTGNTLLPTMLGVVFAASIFVIAKL